MNKVDFIKTSDSWLNDKRNNKKQEFTYSYPNFWDFTFANEKASTKKLLHPNQKNVKLLEILIQLSTQKGDTVLDPFVGSGTTALASIQTNRNFLACERDEGYVKIANDRLENWQEDLLRQKEWLEKRGVNDFFDDIEMSKTEQQETLI